MHLRRILPCWLLAVAILANPMRAEDAAERAAEIAKMKRIWEALMAYKKANGQLPDHLSDIVPQFLPNPIDLLAPRDVGRNLGDLPQGEKYPSSYEYEWGPRNIEKLTITEIKQCQLEEFGPVVPLLRRLSLAPILGVSHAGDVYDSTWRWESSPEVQKLIAERGLGPGASSGKFLEVVTKDPSGRPVSGVKVEVSDRKVAGASLPVRTLVSGKDGKVRIPFGPVDSMVGELRFEKPGHFAFSQEAPKGGYPGTLAVTVSRARAVGGMVTDPNGSPLANVTVVLARELKKEEEDPKAEWSLRQRLRITGINRIAAFRTGADGRWLFENVPDQADMKLECVMSHPEFAVKILRLERAALQKDGYFADKARTALMKPFAVRGKVVGLDGKPSPGATVALYPSIDPIADRNLLQPIETKVNSDGEFELRTRIPGAAKVAVVPKFGGTPRLQAVTISPEMEDLRIVLAPGRVVTGKVMNNRNKAVPGVNILLTGWVEDVTLPTSPVIATTDIQGNWEWKNAPEGTVSGRVILPSGTFVDWRETEGKVAPIKVEAVDEVGDAER